MLHEGFWCDLFYKGESVKKEVDNEEIFNLEELAISTSLELEALIEILAEKKIITKEEMINKMKNLAKLIE